MDPTVGDGQRQQDAQVTAATRVARAWEYAVSLVGLRLRQAQGDVRAAERSVLMGVMFGVIAFVLFLLALPLIVTAVILALATVVPPWLAVLIVLLVMLALVAGLLLMARLRLRWQGISIVQDLRADWEAVRQKVGQGR
jgi:protein-S-isoprenylcysteine O-methyltransferase Ste14